MSSSSQVVETWIASFCSLLGHEYFAEVSEDFIEDDFNLTGLSSQVPMYKEALEMILDVEPEEDEDEDEEDEEEDEDEDLGEEDGGDGGYPRGGSGASDKKNLRINNDINVIESSAELLYGLIHQRYITSRPGMGQMKNKYDLGHFGTCPRVKCNACKVLPVGCSDTSRRDTVKLFCPSCLDTYAPPNSRFQNVDGAFFGTTFGCLFFMTFPDLQINPLSNLPPPHTSDPIHSSAENTNNNTSTISTKTTALKDARPQPSEINGVATINLAPGLGHSNVYEARIYGFRVSESAKTGPRMKWLRSKPEDVRELDEVRRYHAAKTRQGQPSHGDEYDDLEELETGVAGAAGAAAAGGDEGAALGGGRRRGGQIVEADRRKKAPIRRRRRVGSGGTAGPAAAAAPATAAAEVGNGKNGVNGVG